MKRAFGVSLTGDLYERACEVGFGLPPDRKRRHRLRLIEEAGLLFIHVPKNAGMSISNALYGEQIKHATIRYYHHAAPRLLRRTTSFAVLRDPVERFASAFAYARAGGSAHNQVAAPFRETYRGFGDVNAALDHLEAARSVYAIDHIFRLQSWYVSDRRGRRSVDRLFLFDEPDRLAAFLDRRGAAPLTHINAAPRERACFSPEQINRIRAFYAADVALIEAVRAEARRQRGHAFDRAMGAKMRAGKPAAPEARIFPHRDRAGRLSVQFQPGAQDGVHAPEGDEGDAPRPAVNGDQVHVIK
ncbi:sulfotransferase family 2 domain-containing protein [Sphingomonas sp.]|uniref:sulfotransferase family 2 domain-containing protein n=1 Tax=Sphingomonas sp. TaxID=28214 RepID=UPI0025D0F72E|nr:sulfotransferase family 2 domain-containing protein [Sphingomonas sp.]